jgi:hypothetical protein
VVQDRHHSVDLNLDSSRNKGRGGGRAFFILIGLICDRKQQAAPYIRPEWHLRRLGICLLALSNREIAAGMG